MAIVASLHGGDGQVPTSVAPPTLSSVTSVNRCLRSHPPAPAGTTSGVSRPRCLSDAQVQVIQMQV